MSETQATVSGSKVVFLCEDRSFDFRDLIDAAHFRGELEPIWKNLLRLIAAERKADADELEVDDEAIESAVPIINAHKRRTRFMARPPVRAQDGSPVSASSLMLRKRCGKMS